MRVIRVFIVLACFLPLGSANGQAPPPPWTIGPYAYDQAGNIRTIGTSVYVYDTENRLVHEKIGTQKPQALTYDGFGNIRTITEGIKLQTVGVTPGTNRADAASTALNHMYGTYDGAGNMVTTVTTTDTASPRTHAYTYDALNVVTKSTTDASRAYVYNANDERIGVITVAANGSESSSQWTIRDPGGQVLRRFSREGGQWRWMQDYVYRGGKMLASESNDQLETLHYHLDHLGTPRLITGNGGAEVARHTYYPFGEEAPGPTAPQVAEPKKFTGHERDSGGIDYMHARYYDYSMGRFLSVDPAKSAAMSMPQTWNRYSYTANNPGGRVDPNGLDWYAVLQQGGAHKGGVGKVEHEAIVWIDPRGYGLTYEHPAGKDEYIGPYSGSHANTIGGGAPRMNLVSTRFRNLGPGYDPAAARQRAIVGPDRLYQGGMLQCTNYVAFMVW